MNDHVYVFSGSFEDRDTACKYTQEQWELEPGDSASDQEYAAWEDRNPSWQMLSDLGLDNLDSDFIETIDGDERFEYLDKVLTERSAVDLIRATSGDDDNTLVLIFSEALGGLPAEMKSTPRLNYCGQFACHL